MTFKIGDKVRVLPCRGWSLRFVEGDEFTVTNLQYLENRVIGVFIDDGNPEWCNLNRFELVVTPDPLVEARKLLEAAGFTVNEPQPKAGVVLVVEDKGYPDCVTCVTLDNWNNDTTFFEECYNIIAKINWTAGDGI